MSVVEKVTAELERLGARALESPEGATALSLAHDLDNPRTSATARSMCSKAMLDVLRELRVLAPPMQEEDEVERARKRRIDRLARKSAAGSSSSS